LDGSARAVLIDILAAVKENLTVEEDTAAEVEAEPVR
jgi:hypothetical protein